MIAAVLPEMGIAVRIGPDQLRWSKAAGQPGKAGVLDEASELAARSVPSVEIATRHHGGKLFTAVSVQILNDQSVRATESVG